MGLTSRIHLQQSSPNLNQIVGRSTGHSNPSKSGTRRPPNVAEKWPLEKKYETTIVEICYKFFLCNCFISFRAARKYSDVGECFRYSDVGECFIIRNGIYTFSFTGMAYLPASSSRVVLDLDMYLNGKVLARGNDGEVGTAGQWEKFSFQSTLGRV